MNSAPASAGEAVQDITPGGCRRAPVLSAPLAGAGIRF